jgi:hypothetical protein
MNSLQVMKAISAREVALARRGWQLGASPVLTYHGNQSEDDEVTRKAIEEYEKASCVGGTEYENARIERLAKRYGRTFPPPIPEEAELLNNSDDEEEWNENARRSCKRVSKACEDEQGKDELDQLTPEELNKLEGKEFCIALIRQVQGQINRSKREQERKDVLESVTNIYQSLYNETAKGLGSTFRKVAKRSKPTQIGLPTTLGIAASLAKGSRKHKRKVKEQLIAWQKGSSGLAHAMSPSSFRYTCKQKQA